MYALEGNTTTTIYNDDDDDDENTCDWNRRKKCEIEISIDLFGYIHRNTCMYSSSSLLWSIDSFVCSVK